MIDTHCHLLPDLDDGPRGAEDAVALGHGLVEAGVRIVLCTPHFSRRFPTDHDEARRRLVELTELFARRGLVLRCVLAAEVSSAAAVEAPLAALSRRRIGRRHLLVELEPDTAAGIVPVVQERLAGAGLIPVFAHPERCRAVREQPQILDRAREGGALVQVVAPSLAGRWGHAAVTAGWQLLESQRADLLASDCHRARHAGEALREVLEEVALRLGEAMTAELTETNPRRLLDRPPA